VGAPSRAPRASDAVLRAGVRVALRAGALVALLAAFVLGAQADAPEGPRLDEPGPDIVDEPRAPVAAALPVEPRRVHHARPPRAGRAPPEPRPGRPGATPPVENAAALAGFYAALERTRRGEGLTRVTNLGDSSIGMDALPHALRMRFARDLGDAGPGYVLLEPESPSYRNRTVALRTGPPWDVCVMIRRCKRDARYGLGGALAESRGGASTRIAPRDGREVSRAELWYLAQPRGGRLGFTFGDAPEVVIDTRSPGVEGRWRVLERAPGAHPVRVRALGRGQVRVFGVVLENEGPGIVWDTLSVVGAFTHRVLAHDEGHFARQLARRDPDLVVLNYGGNDLRRMIFGGVDREGLEEETLQVLSRVRAAVPDAGCLVVGISDHTRSGTARVRPAQVEAVLDAQRHAARRAGCAFWDTTHAMGGAGSFERWRRHGLAANDGKHLTERGRRLVADRLHAALVHAALVHAALVHAGDPTDERPSAAARQRAGGAAQPPARASSSGTSRASASSTAAGR
jgi:lysophospholipase L1-like esterase